MKSSRKMGHVVAIDSDDEADLRDAQWIRADQMEAGAAYFLDMRQKWVVVHAIGKDPLSILLFFTFEDGSTTWMRPAELVPARRAVARDPVEAVRAGDEVMFSGAWRYVRAVNAPSGGRSRRFGLVFDDSTTFYDPGELVARRRSAVASALQSVAAWTPPDPSVEREAIAADAMRAGAIVDAAAAENTITPRQKKAFSTILASPHCFRGDIEDVLARVTEGGGEAGLRAAALRSQLMGNRQW
jgi:hypothetical protein